MRYFLTVLWIVLLTGCATVGSEKLALRPQNTKVVVVSLMADQLKVRHVGTTVFSNAQHDVDVSNWNINQQIEDETNKLLQNAGKFAVVKAAGTDFREKFGVPVRSLWDGTTSLDHVKDGVQVVARESGADLVMVIRQAEYGDPFFGTNQSFSGYGIYQRSFLFSKKAINFVTMNVNVFDGKTGESIASTRQFMSGVRGEADWLSGEDLMLSNENAEKTKTEIAQLVQFVLKKSLAELTVVSL